MKIFKETFTTIGIVLTIVFIIFWQPMINFFANISFDHLKIINSFLEVIISWPLAIFLLGITFLLHFKEQIKEFLKNMHSFKIGNVEASTQQKETQIEDSVIYTEANTDLISKEDLETMLANKDTEIEDIKKSFIFAWERAENYEMAYLKKALVPATWYALNWLINQDGKKSTKEWFMRSINVSDAAPDKVAEKEAIFNVLLVNELITFNNSIMIPTKKAEKFLKYVGVIK